ncbi:uncharacterized protein PV07_12633 [Cladophialophora immunda]|uniref:Telomeric single stranded DNA binding POT1/Cdc13 domain-containing protein n=1 Tax=Cladophialophora immunda TaxID=569365 RepID=A0A0D2AB21_9EURO|nr:uncharacterized protein PV07_12633 [Cladophialophora immunda]KIW21962.1 hypothetical protein PV07_12633 [Cladophialophora immunda]
MPQPTGRIESSEPNSVGAAWIFTHWSSEKEKRDTPGGIATSLAYYPHLNTLREYFGRPVDVIAVSKEASPPPVRSRSGPKDYLITLRLVDPSLVPERQQGIATRIFRPDEHALPKVYRGDVVVLHDFQVQNRRREISLSSTNTSAWAVFRKGRLEGDISGPPLEYGAGESALARILFDWWIQIDHRQPPAGAVVPHYEENIETTEGTD